ncbi:MAG TPA: FeoB small GTPase domain-containing protein, partial [Xanthomonadales bacterium]|nr:FeoB small GTPase domain-containing protein [Xanthomonadales bacterium]
MAESITSSVNISDIAIRRKPGASVAIIGNPNSGKSTLFNRLTGLRQTTGNYPGVTVEKHVGSVQLEKSAVSLVDLPGTYCLNGQSLDERIAVDVLLGRLPGQERPDAVLFVLDASQPYQGLYLLEHVLEIGIPTIVALTMSDVAEANGISTDTRALGQRLGGIEVVPVDATSGSGIGQLRQVLERVTSDRAPFRPKPRSWPALGESADRLSTNISLSASANTSDQMDRIDVIHALLNPESDLA